MEQRNEDKKIVDAFVEKLNDLMKDYGVELHAVAFLPSEMINERAGIKLFGTGEQVAIEGIIVPVVAGDKNA